MGGYNSGKTIFHYAVTLPDGRIMKKRAFRDRGDHPIATGLRLRNGGATITLWDNEPAWDGDFGRMVARRTEAFRP